MYYSNDAAFTIRETLDPESLESLKESLIEDGQWDPIIVRSKGEGYELIAGHRRVQAAKEIGWSDIEGNVVNLSDSEALFLALKTNLMREDMSDIEQGRVLHQITQEYSISAHDLSLKLGKGKNWVSQRIKLALNLHPDVAKALEAEKISTHVAEIISTLDLPSQREFLIYLSDNNITNENEVRKTKKRFLNQTIYTIGHEDRKLTDFMQILKDNGIEYVLDIRDLTIDIEDPNFTKDILSRELEREKIHYRHDEDLSIPEYFQFMYDDNGILYACFEKGYVWQLKSTLDFQSVVDGIKDCIKV